MSERKRREAQRMEKCYPEQVVISTDPPAGGGIQLTDLSDGSPRRMGMTEEKILEPFDTAQGKQVQDDKESGFTLLELLLTVAVFTILMLSSTVFYSRFINQNATSTTVSELVGELEKAQMYAMLGRNFTGSNGGWGVNVTPTKMTLYQGSSFTTRNSALDESFDISSNVSVTGGTDINFAHFTGLPNTTATISLTGNSTTKTVSVNSQGVVSND